MFSVSFKVFYRIYIFRDALWAAAKTAIADEAGAWQHKLELR